MRLLTSLVLALVLIAAAIAAVVASGAWNVAATSPPGKLEQRFATFALDRSVAKRAPANRNPLPASPDVLRSGLAHYRENCAVCHGAPGIEGSEIAAGLNPAAPDLTLPRVQRRPDGELFWIVSNGIRMTGMPGFGPTHKPDEIWKMVAFLRHLPELTPAEEAALGPSEAAESHHEESGEGETRPPGARPTPHAHPPGTGPHHH